MTEKPFRGGLIGCGFFAQNHLHAWMMIRNARIEALCDHNEARLNEVGDAFGIARRYVDPVKMLAEEALDFVDIATTVASHRPLVELAARHSVPAICQKPFAPGLADSKAMVAAFSAAGKPLMVHENFRWQSPIRAVKSALDSGVIGKAFWGRISFRSAFDVFSGQPYLAEGERFIIEDLGVHCLDIARFLFGDATRLFARTQRVNQAIKGEDIATITLGHADGATSIVDVSYATRLPEEPFPETFVEIDGEEGSLRLGKDYALTITGKVGVTRRTVAPILLPWASRPWHNIQESVHAIEQHWIDCLGKGIEPETSGRDNLKTAALVEAAYLSAKTGEAVDPIALLERA
jgi:D-apiose dehydrogenase